MRPARRRDAIYDVVRRHCATVATVARWIEIDAEALASTGSTEGLDPDLHFLDGEPEEVARYVLVLDTVNFGSGWFESLDLPAGQSGTVAVTRALTEYARRRGGTWNGDELRAMTTDGVARVLGQPSGHPLMGLYAEALVQLGAWLGGDGALARIAAAGGSADAFARSLAGGMPFFDDVGFYKRAQITANDLVHAGVAVFEDVDALTVFADNLVPHVLRGDGVLRYAPELAERVDAGIPLAPGSAISAPAPSTPASSSPAISRWRRGGSTTGSGTGARTSRLRRGARTGRRRSSTRTPAGPRDYARRQRGAGRRARDPFPAQIRARSGRNTKVFLASEPGRAQPRVSVTPAQ